MKERACQYHENGILVHAVAATHVVIGRGRPLHWDIFLALPEQGETGEFCLRHAMDVATMRQNPNRRGEA